MLITLQNFHCIPTVFMERNEGYKKQVHFVEEKRDFQKLTVLQLYTIFFLVHGQKDSLKSEKKWNWW